MHRKFEDWYMFCVELFSYVYKEYAMHFLTVFFIYITKFKANNFESIIETTFEVIRTCMYTYIYS